MKMTYRIDRMLFELEAETTKELFHMLADVQSAFEADRCCGRCNSTNVQFRVRNVEKGDYYELLCGDCFATLNFGQPRKGGLFASRRDKDKNVLSHRGWRPAWGSGEQEPEYVEVGKAETGF